MSEVLARAAGWSAADAETLRLAAPMHDVGKIGIPDAILRKPGKLTPAEFEVMKTHTTIGAKMLEGSHSAILSMAHDIALSHHERWDGAGYPQGLAGAAIPEPARILSIVDVYDAVSHDRVYRLAMPEDEVLTLMQQGVGTQFDPMLVAVFLAHFEEMRRIAQENPDEAATSRPPLERRCVHQYVPGCNTVVCKRATIPPGGPITTNRFPTVAAAFHAVRMEVRDFSGVRLVGYGDLRHHVALLDLLTTFWPSITRPKTECLPSNQGVATWVMKNWEPLVLGPALAIESTPDRRASGPCGIHP